MWRYTFANTYAAPVLEFLRGAPAAAVDPERATEKAKSSPPAPSAAVSSAFWRRCPQKRPACRASCAPRPSGSLGESQPGARHSMPAVPHKAVRD